MLGLAADASAHSGDGPGSTRAVDQHLSQLRRKIEADPAKALRQLDNSLNTFRTGNGNNWTGWGSKTYDALLDQAATTADPAMSSGAIA